MPPLMHSKTPKAFKKNIETEMEHGKPQKQAVAIAYSEKRADEHHKAHGGCVGPHCKGCSDANCMAEGGEVMKPYDLGEEESELPMITGDSSQDIIDQYRKKEKMDQWRDKRNDLMEKGASGPTGSIDVNMAEGGEVDYENGDMDMEDELRDMMGGELMDALEKKDRKGILDCIEAIVCSMKGEE